MNYLNEVQYIIKSYIYIYYIIYNIYIYIEWYYVYLYIIYNIFNDLYNYINVLDNV